MATAITTTSPRLSQRPWNTLQRLRALRLTLLLLDGLLLLLLLFTVEGTRKTVHRVEGEGAPGVVAAQQIGAALSAMDAAFVADLLRSPGEHDTAVDAYQARRMEVVHGLVNAAEQIAQNESERGPVETLEIQLGDYERLLQRARDLGEREPGQSVVAYRQAAVALDTHLLPAAAALDAIGSGELQKASRAQRLGSSVAATLLIAGGLVLLLVLGISQVSFSRWMHRTLNLPLLAATLLTVGAAIHLGTTLDRGQAALYGGQGETFAAVHRVLSARSAALAALDDESRAVLDNAQTSAWAKLSMQHADAVATLPSSLSPEQLLDAVREGREVPGFAGFLATAATDNGVRGERSLALAALVAWQPYLLATQNTLHLAAAAGKHREAVVALTGPGAARVPALRQGFDDTLEALLSHDGGAFDAQIRQSAAILRREELEGAGIAALLAGLVLLGFEPRMREYR